MAAAAAIVLRNKLIQPSPWAKSVHRDHIRGRVGYATYLFARLDLVGKFESKSHSKCFEALCWSPALVRIITLSGHYASARIQSATRSPIMMQVKLVFARTI